MTKHILVLFTLLSLTLISLASKATERPTISQSQLQSLIDSQSPKIFTLLDVRSADEFNAGHINTAINISHKSLQGDLLTESLAKLPTNKSQLIVTYCRSGRRAGIAEQILRDAGYTNVQHLAGDMNAWSDASLPVEIE